MLAYYQEDWPALVVTPSSLRFNWEAEFHKWLPGLLHSDIRVITTSSSQQRTIGRVPITIISYDLVTRMAEELTRAQFQCIVCDESHYLKSSKAKRTQALTPLVASAKRALFLSGTPALNRPIELYTQVFCWTTISFLFSPPFPLFFRNIPLLLSL